MSEEKVIKAVRSEKAYKESKPTLDQPSLDSQARLAEILNDSPRLVSLKGTEWEVRTLRMGTQWLISKVVSDMIKAKIFKDGKQEYGYSELYHATRDTLEWDCDVTDFGNILLECLQLMSVDFFLQSRDILEIFKKSVLEKKRTRIAGQK